jgi:hypothetical protein
VTGDFKEYLNCFLYSLALASNVSILTLQLSDQAAEAAFRLADRWNHPGNPGEPAQRGSSAEPEPEQEDEPRLSFDENDALSATHLPWETPAVSLEGDLVLVLNKLKEGERVDAKKLLDEIPCFRELKQRAEDNNHKRDGQGPADRQLKVFQQRALNTLRVLAALHTVLNQANPEVVQLSLMLFMYVAETEALLLKERKKLSIPGTVTETTNLLFTQDDLKVEQQASKINRAGLPWCRKNIKYFPTCKGMRSWKFKGGKSYSSSGGFLADSVVDLKAKASVRAVEPRLAVGLAGASAVAKAAQPVPMAGLLIPKTGLLESVSHVDLK